MTNTIELNIQQEYLDFIKSGQKTVEGRIASPSLKSVSVGDVMQFECGDELISCRIIQTKLFPSFEEMLNAMGLQNCLPTVASIAEGVEIYRSFPSYRERETECGVIAFQIQLL